MGGDIRGVLNKWARNSSPETSKESLQHRSCRY